MNAASDADGAKHLVKDIRAFCVTHCGHNTDIELSGPDSLRLLVDLYLQGQVPAMQCVSSFRSELVDLTEAIKERLWGLRGCSVPNTTASDDPVRLLANACVFYATCVRAFPHTRYTVGEVLQSAQRKNGLRAAECLLETCKQARSAESLSYMAALRCLMLHGCLGDVTDSGLDLGLLLRYSVGNAKTAPSSCGLAYCALRLLCALLHVPHVVMMRIACQRLGATELGAAMFAEALDEAACAKARAGSLSAIADASVADNDSMQVIISGAAKLSVGGLLDRPYDQATLHLGGYALPTLRERALVAGVTPSKWVPRMVQTPTSLANCQRLMQAVQTGLPIIVQGDVGCGKSFMIRELAAAMGQEATLLELHLDDQTDSKTLIGAYVCSDVPGEFVWHAGVVTQAALKGNWLVIEDIDRVPLEVIAALAPLLERRRLFLPSRGEEVTVHPSFRLFGTRVTAVHANQAMNSKQKETSSASLQDLTSAMITPSLRHFSHFFVFVTINVPTKREIQLILDARFPSLLPVVKQKLMDTYALFRRSDDKKVQDEGSSGEMKETSDEVTEMNASKAAAILTRNTRQFTLRDLVKAAGRCARYGSSFNHTSGFLTEAQRRNLLNEVVDVFGASSRTSDAYEQLVHRLGAAWGVPIEEVDTFVVNGEPQWETNAERCVVGRGLVTCTPGAALSGEGQQFAFTRHALRVLERVAVCVAMDEPALLVGETGSGKTTSVQELANMTHRKLVVQNLSLSTDASDLLGGFRPVTVRQLFHPTYLLFVELFQDTFSSSSNTEFLQVTSQLFKRQQWKRLLKAFLKASDNACQKLQSQGGATARITRLMTAWNDFNSRVKRFEVNLPRIEFGFAFAFVDGLLVDAMRAGHWVLLDEINLATPETLQGIAGILDGQSLCLTERGDVEPVVRHADFRVFAAMNPPTDVGKKELPASLRGRFTEIYVAEMTDPRDLSSVVGRYLQNISNAPVDEIVSVYLGSRLASENVLVDSGGQRARYSLRSLTRSLEAAKSFLGLNIRPLNRALFEGFLLNFQTLLGEASRKHMWNYLKEALKVPGGKELTTPPSRPGGKGGKGQWTLVGPFWLKTGPLDCVDWAERDTTTGTTRFVMTATVEASIRDLAAAVASGVAPVLLQGPTSVGKTTMIEYLAARTGHKCIRINNHEHTDVQEYIGGYVTNAFGQLEFRDGLLVEALRQGHWIILDELNLAPSDVLEALNRLLDDNRELFIPETGETVRPAEGFTLFATQNPPGVYGGRKPLSRAFRNRFLELSICDLPRKDVEDIITHSCGIPPRFAKMLVDVMVALQLQRQASNVFQGKHGSITTRDLIKWGRRQPRTPLEVAEEGYMLLAEKLRLSEEKDGVCQTLNLICKVQMDPLHLYSEASGEEKSSDAATAGLSDMIDEEGQLRQGRDDLIALRQVQERLREGSLEVEGVRGVAITAAMRRMWRLVGRCISHDEPALLIGETGSGKTTVCQLFAAHLGQRIRILNCHQSTETADIIGGLRPVRGREAIFSSLLGHITSAFIPAAACASTTMKDELNVLVGELQAAERVEAAPIPEELVKKVVDILAKIVSEAAAAATNNADAADLDQMQPLKKVKSLDGEALQREPTPEESEEAAAARSELSRLSAMCTSSWLRYKSLFEWQDGPLVTAMKEGDIFVLDEINLAEDAVVERLNSVLESGRSLTLAEKGGELSERVIAHPKFKFLATMNPGGDFGKRELSPALRSRFTEMYTPGVNTASDLELIVTEIINVAAARGEGGSIASAPALAAAMVAFMGWLNKEVVALSITGIFVSIREVLAWARFVSQSRPTDVAESWAAMLHGAHMVLLDGLGLGLAVSRELVRKLRFNCVLQLIGSCPASLQESIRAILEVAPGEQVKLADGRFHLGAFSIQMGLQPVKSSTGYVLSARSTVTNLHRILRAMQLKRPVLLEGPPGVGKSSIIANLAALAGHTLVRINLSEHSEISDLLGTDLPAPSEPISQNSTDAPARKSQSSNTKFVWCDGVFLQAMKAGHWVLLDELNLAPQSVLEGLNACFDHREEVYLPEIGRSFRCPPTFRVFCAQNPMGEGGGRKGLPQSFLTRFSRVFVEAMTEEDMCEIASQAFQVDKASAISVGTAGGEETMVIDEHNTAEAEIAVLERARSTLAASYVPQMVAFIRRLQSDVVTECAYGRSGGPWEFNLRDVFRWCELVQELARMRAILPANLGTLSVDSYLIADAAHSLFVCRLREARDRDCVCKAFKDVFGFALAVDLTPEIRSTEDAAYIGAARVPIKSTLYLGNSSASRSVHGSLSRTLETLAHAVSLRWPVLLVGSSGSGKRRALRNLSAVCGQRLVEFSATSSTDSNDLLGTFEQASDARTLYAAVAAAEHAVMMLCGAGIPAVAAASAGLNPLLIKMLSTLSIVKVAAEKVAGENQFALEAGTALRKRILSLFDIIVEAAALLPAVAESVAEPLAKARASLEVCLSKNVATNNPRGGFEWVDGVVVRAVESGHWLLIDNVNLCSASVLDRLNSLLEPNGTLLLTEGGGGRVVTAHPNFRVFLAMDPVYGEISRAMRNRCVEIALLPEPGALIAAMSIRQTFGSADATLEASLMNLYSRMQGSASVTALLPPAFPVQRLFARLLHVVAAELSAGHNSSEALLRAVQCVAPPLTLALSAQEGNQSVVPYREERSRNDDACQLLETLAPELPAQVLACLHLLVDAAPAPAKTKTINLLTDSESELLWVAAARRAAMHRARLAGSSCIGAKVDYERMDELARLDGETVQPLVMAELLRATSLEPRWVAEVATHFLTSLSNDNATGVSLDLKAWEERIQSLPVFASVMPEGAELFGCSINEDQRQRASLVAQAISSSQTSTHSTLTAASSLVELPFTMNGGIDAATLCLARARPLWKYVDLVFLHRLPLLSAEADARMQVDNTSALGGMVHFASLYSLAYAMSRELIAPDTAELRVLLRIFHVLHCADGLIAGLSAHLVGILEDDKTTQLNTLNELLSGRLQAFVVRRDGLASTLLTKDAPTPTADGTLNVELPWEPLLISTRWLQKTARALLQDTSMTTLGEFFEREGTGILHELGHFDTAVGHYWRRPVYSEKLRLWKEGGHAAVPASEQAWDLLHSIEAALLPPAATFQSDISGIADDLENVLPSFVDSSAEYGAVGVHAVPHRSVPTSLLKEWLALLCTFYYTHTAEVPGTGTQLAVASTEDMDPLVAVLQSDFIRMWHKREHGSTENQQFASDAAFMATHGDSEVTRTDSAEQRLSRLALHNAKQEINDARESALSVLAEPFVVNSILCVTDLLASLLGLDTQPTQTELFRLRDLLKTCVGVALRHSTFDPRMLRELQSLLWSVDACLGGSMEKLAQFLLLARATLYTLDVRLFVMTTRGLGNSVSAIDFSYGSRSLSALLDTSNVDLSEDAQKARVVAAHRGSQVQRFFSPETLATSGIALLLQPATLRVVMRHVDVRALSSCVLGAGSLSLLTNGVAGLTVSTCTAAHKRLLQMFRMTAMTSLTTPEFDPKLQQINRVHGSVRATFARLSLLYRLSIDVLKACRDFFSAELLECIAAIQLNGAFDAAGSDIGAACAQLLALSLPSQCRSPVLAQLLQQCLMPVWQLLTRQDVWSAPWSHPLPIGRAWALAGLLQVHLSLPSLPVDPAAKAGVKATLLDTELRACSRRVGLDYSLSSLRGGAGTTAGVLEGVERATAIDIKASRLRAIAIHRPANGRPFPDVFFELRDAVDSLGRVETVISLLDRLEQTLSAVVQSGSRAGLESLRHCVQEEFVWQGSAASVLDRATGQNMGVYVDVCSPILSGLQHISSGLRLVSGHCLMAGEDAASGNANKNIRREPLAIWRSILQYPTSSSLDVQSGSQERLTAQALADVCELLQGRDAAIARATRLLKSARTVQDQGGNNARSVLPHLGSIDAAASGHLLLLALSKVDHYVGSGTLQASDTYEVFNSVLDGFVESHLRAEDARRAKAAAKAALFRNKTKENSYEANEEKEELAALRQHFPDHLKGFRDILAYVRGPEGQLLYNFEDEEEKEEEEDAAITEAGGASSVLLDQEFDEHVTASLVGYHARMIFLHQATEHASRQRTWRRSRASAGSDADAPLLLREALLTSLHQHSLAAAKCLDWGLRGILSPGLDASMRGASMAALATMAAHSAPASAAHGGVARDASVALWAKALGAGATSLNDADVDRDLLLLLLGDTAFGAWRPRNFHLDPAPQEAIRASVPVQRLFERASQLLALYPGNELLLQVCRVCSRVADFHVSTPVGKLLAAVQLLYRQAADWEQFAASHVSLAVEMQGLAVLIGQWREQELASWDQLLRGKEVEYAKKASAHWCSLARVLRSMPSDTDFANEAQEKRDFKTLQMAERVSGPYRWPNMLAHAPVWLLLAVVPGQVNVSLAAEVKNEPVAAAVDDDEIQTVWGAAAIRLHKKADADAEIKPLTAQAYLQSLFDILDGFLRKCNLGEFPCRLHLVRLFALQMEQECLQEKEEEEEVERVLRRIQQRRAHLVFGIWRYYAQFLPLVRNFQDSHRDPLITRIRGEVKIGKWDQMSTYALMAHSEKTHGKLNKLIREYQSNVLDQSVSIVMRKDLMGDLASEQGELQGAVDVPTHSSFFPSLPKLSGETIEKAMNVPLPLADEAASQLAIALASGTQRYAIIAASANKLSIAAYTHSTSAGALEAYPKLLRLKTLGSKMDKYAQELLTCAEPEPLPEAPVKVSKMKIEKEKIVTSDDDEDEDSASDSESEEDVAESPRLTVRFEGRTRFGLLAADIAEDYCADIFARIQALRQDKVPKAAKHRAVVDMLAVLRQGGGFSYLRNALPAELKDTVSLLSVPAPLPCESAGDLRWASNTSRDLLESGESYFARSVAELMQLRTQAVAPSARDVSLREIQVMLGLSENIFATQLRMRLGLRAALQDYRQLMAAMGGLEEALALTVSASTSTSAPGVSRAYLLRAGSAVLDNLLQLRRLVIAAAAAHSPDVVEEDSALPYVDGTEIQVALKAVNAAVQAQQNMLDTASDGGAAPATSATWNNYELPRGASDYLDSPLPVAIQQKISKFAHAADSALQGASPVLILLLSRDVLAPVLESVNGICAYLSNSATAATAAAVVVVAEADMEESQHDHVGAALLSTTVDTCLTSIQRLRAMAAPIGSADIPLTAVDAESVLMGILGGTKPAQRTTPNSAELEALQRKRDAQAGTLHESLGLSLGAVATLQTHHLSASLDNVRSHVLTSANRETAMLALTVMPLARRLAAVQSVLLGDLCGAYKAVGKLMYVSLRVFRVLLAKGLCSDESKDGEGDGSGDGANMTFTDDVEGTGMGEGQGKTDVSDQIENEEQLAGLKDDKDKDGESEEKKPSEKLKEEDKDKGVEMSQNFEGDMYDIPEDENPQEDEDDKDDQEDLERELGEADKDDIVDEKQWDSDEDEEPGEEGEGFEKDSKMQGDELEGETHTRGDKEDDEKGDDEDEKGKDKKPDPSKTEPEGADMEEEDDEGKINEQDGEEQAKPQGVDVRQDEKLPEEDEPLQGDEQGDEQNPNEDEDGKHEEEEEGEGKDQDLPDNMQLEGGEEGAENEDGEGSDMDPEDQDIEDAELPEGEDADNMEVDEDKEEDEDRPDQQSAAISTSGGNEPEENEKKDEEKEEEDKEEEENAKKVESAEAEADSKPAAFGVNVGEQDAGEAVLGTENAEDAPAPEQADTAGPKGQGARSKGAGDSGESTEAGGEDVHDGKKPPPAREREPPNPFKERGDINKAWHRRLNLATAEEDGEDEPEEPAAQEQDQKNEPKDKKGRGLFEYGKDEEDGEQVLADELEDQAAQLPQGNEKQDDKEVTEQPDKEDDQHNMDEDEPDKAPKKETKSKKRDRSSTKGEEEKESETKKQRQEEENINSDDEMPEKEAEDVDDDVQKGEEAQAEDERNGKQVRTDATFRMREDTSDIVEDDSMHLLELQRAGEDFGYAIEGIDAARELWAKHRSATDTHSMRLCEQLRLVLEPTLATRLQGDYRTGKRINMRRVIGYVASGFRKDKIWLRRTKPAKREYQVMLMIDDSKSMGEAGPLALSALATISNALSKLEVGDLSVCAFAEGVRQLHPFGRPFNEEAGAHVVSQFTFQQDRTLLGASLSAVAPIFTEAARSTSSSSGPAAVCLQICFVISDARLDSDNRLRLDSVVRKMAEQNILVVLIILDKNDDPKDSIFNTKSIEFVEDKIVTKNYLDDFPFPYYIAIQKLDVLPDVLADALKQWFELIGSQIDNA